MTLSSDTTIVTFQGDKPVVVSIDVLARAIGVPTSEQMAYLAIAADTAIGQIEALADDGVLTASEKQTKLIPLDSELDAIWQALDSRAGTVSADVSVQPARNVASASRAAWQTYRDTLAPAWNDTTTDTAVDRATFDGRLEDYRLALTKLTDALRQAAARTANYSQTYDDVGTKPDDNATNSADPDSPFGPVQTVGQAIAALEQARMDIDGLVANYGSTEAAAAAALAAAVARDAAQVAQKAAETAEGLAQGAVTSANDEAQKALDARNLADSSAKAADTSARASAGSAHDASASADSAGAKANVASGFADQAYSSWQQADGSAKAASTSADAASTSAGDSGRSASAAQLSSVSAKLGAAQTFPTGFSTQEQPFWGHDEFGNPATAAASTYDASWYGEDDGVPAFVTKAGQGSLVLVPIGRFVPVVGRRYRISVQVHCVTATANGAPSYAYTGFAVLKTDSTASFPSITSTDLNAIGAGNFATLTNDWVCQAGDAAAYARPRFHYNWNNSTDGSGTFSDAVYKFTSFVFEDVTAEQAAADSAHASADSATTAGVSETNAGRSAGAASRSEINAGTSAGDANRFSSSASDSATRAGISESNASGSASTAGSAARDAATARDAAGGSAQAASQSAGTAQGFASQADLSAQAALRSETSASSSSRDATSAAGTATDQASLAGKSAAAAQQSAMLSASIGPGLLNPNAAFGAWVDPNGNPDGWLLYANQPSGSFGRTGGNVSPYAASIGNWSVCRQAGFVRIIDGAPLIIEADLRPNGPTDGVYICLQWFTDDTSTVQGGWYYALSNTPAENEQAAASYNGDVRRYRIYTDARVSGAREFCCYIDTHESSTCIIDRFGFRLASQAEIEGTAALAGLAAKADITYAQQVGADAQGNAIAASQNDFNAKFSGVTPTGLSNLIGQRPTYGEVDSSVSQKVTAATGPSSALAQTQNTLVAQMAGQQGSYLKGQVDDVRGVATRADGRTQAFVNISTQADNNMAYVAIFANNGQGGLTSGVILGGNTYVDGNLIVSGSIQTGGIANGSISSTHEAQWGNLVLGNGDVQASGSLTVPVSGDGPAGVAVFLQLVATRNGGRATNLNVSLCRDGSPVGIGTEVTAATAGFGVQQGFFVLDSPGGGNHSYYLQFGVDDVDQGGGWNVDGIQALFMEFRR